MYLTGGIGPSRHNEGFTTDYDLPDETAYAETCAAIGLVMWNHRLLQFAGDGKYADIIERRLYNGFISGVSLDGDTFFYVNPLASAGDHHRTPWFECPCCPPNVAPHPGQRGQLPLFHRRRRALGAPLRPELGASGDRRAAGGRAPDLALPVGWQREAGATPGAARHSRCTCASPAGAPPASFHPGLR